jgi:hypothetical protein
MPGEPSRRRSGRSHEALGNERPRGMAITARDCSKGRDRTRLTRRLALFELRTFHEHYNSDAAFCDLGQGDSYMLWSRHTDGGHFRNSRFYL